MTNSIPCDSPTTIKTTILVLTGPTTIKTAVLVLTAEAVL